MTAVTREDVARTLYITHKQATEPAWSPGEPAEIWDRVIATDPRSKHTLDYWLARADALIAAFPHLVGEVHDEQDDSGYGQYGQPVGPSRTVYTVTGPWREIVQ